MRKKSRDALDFRSYKVHFTHINGEESQSQNQRENRLNDGLGHDIQFGRKKIPLLLLFNWTNAGRFNVSVKKGHNLNDESYINCKRRRE